MKVKLITNPYIIYAFAFSLVLVLYPLHWSNLYPELSTNTVVFFTLTILISTIAGLFFHKSDYFSYTEINYSNRTLWMSSIFIFVAYLPEFVYVKTIPVYALSTGLDYDYASFGIPTYHVVLVTFNSFWTVFVFHTMISKKNKSLFIPYLICLIPSILIFSRGMFIIMLTSSLFVLLMSTRKIVKLILRIGVLLCVILFLFGLAGNIRITGDVTASDTILGIGEATSKFEKSFIPGDFFWAYLYVTSSLANLQETINVHYSFDFSFERFSYFMNSEILPDFISKRNELLFMHKESINQISSSFNVGTVYARSYAYFGWVGMVIMFIYLLLFNLFVIISVSKRSIFFVSSIAILCSLMLFNIFDNMFTFSGTVLQLVYPIVLGAGNKIRFLVG